MEEDMAEVNLLSAFPRKKRNIEKRATAKTQKIINLSREYRRLVSTSLARLVMADIDTMVVGFQLQRHD